MYVVSDTLTSQSLLSHHCSNRGFKIPKSPVLTRMFAVEIRKSGYALLHVSITDLPKQSAMQPSAIGSLPDWKPDTTVVGAIMSLSLSLVKYRQNDLSLPSSDLSRVVVSHWQKYVHCTHQVQINP